MAHEAPHVRGFLYHFVNIETGERFGVSELSPIDMAILLCGVLTCRQYFSDPGIRRDATEIYQRVDWPWALNGGNTFALDWVPELGFSSLRWDSYCESMMLYLLAMGSPTHPIPGECWPAIRRPWMTYDAYKFISTPDYGKEELYDLIHDGGETHNLVEQEPRLAAVLRDKVRSYRDE